MSSGAETLTHFLRNPKQVLAKVDRQDVVLVRTGGRPAIRLSLESRAAAADSSSEMAAHLLADAVASLPEISGRLPELLEHRLPWVRLLPPGERMTFAREFVETLQACVSGGNTARLRDLLGDWKATAVVHSDPALAAELKRPLSGTRIRVPRPSARAAKR